MWFFKNLSINTKLNLLVIMASGVALLLSSVAFVSNDYQMIRASKVRQLTALANVLGSNSTAALTFDDPSTATELLSSLRVQPTVQFACLYDARGKVFARYVNGASPKVVPPPDKSGHKFTESGYLDVTKQIVQDGELIGTIYFHTTMHDLRAQLIRYAGIVAVVMIVSLTGSFVLSSTLQRAISKPILRLAKTAQRISAEGDYSVRVQKDANDELGMLCDDFNNMLGHIERSEKSLQQVLDELEIRVQDRTLELSRTNQALTQEIGERKRTEAELKVAKKVAETANQSKSEFLANMSHEIRTPMTAILGFSEILMGSVMDQEQLDAAKTIKRNGEYLIKIINDILDLSKIEAGKLEIEHVQCSPCQVLSEVTSLMRVRANAKNLSLQIDYDGPIPQTIQSDPTRLRQILINLTGNAIKFTEVGEIRLVARLLDAECDEPKMQFEVIDSGIGMTGEQIAKLFNPFQQADTSTTRKFGGTGLGLTICKRLASKLGGDISVKSTAGEGSTFTVTVGTGPLDGVKLLDNPSEAQLPTHSDKKPAAPKIKLDCRVLLAEDGPDNQRLIAFLLKKAGAEVVVADNGLIAHDLALAARDEGTPFDVILMDIQMPVMDGYEATAKLRKAGYTGPIIALTAHAMSTARDKCLNAGCNDYTTKPIDHKKLISVVAEYASGQGLLKSGDIPVS